eukprot:gene10383-21642_t
MDVATLNVVVAKAAGRDKFWRGVQYGSRMMFGYFALLIDKAEAAGDTAAVTLLKVRHGHWRRMFVHTMEARRTFRFFASSGPITTMQKAVCPWGEEWRPAFVASKSLFVAWQLLDHLRFFQVLKWAPGDVARTRRISFGCFTFSCLIEFVNKLKRQSFRAALMTITYAHVSELYPNHDTICGAAGLVTSIMDVKDLWPK